LRLHDTLSGRKEEFQPLGDPVRLYVCGVTPYDESHIGHAMSYIIFDVLRRYLEYRGHRVRHVQNFTDIDDRIIARANRKGVSASELAEANIGSYFEDMDALNIKRAHVYPRATQEIPKIIELVAGLIDRGHAYEAEGDVYFSVESVPDYGKLSHRTLESMSAGARVEPGERKRHPMDFALWKAAKPGEPAWESPWGQGRPGWHIECSAMSLRHLGEQIDIHGGGQDLIFPHHENEIAQSESFTGVKPFVRYWMHNGLLQLGEEKMSKSLGNLVTVKEVLRRHSPDALRLFVLSSYYRGPLSYSEEALAAAQRGADRLAAALQAASEGPETETDVSAQRAQFIGAMEDDLNTSQALAVLFDLAREVNRAREEGRDASAARQLMRELGDVLGLTFQRREQADRLGAAPFIELLIETRAKLREAKQWQLADGIRAQLKGLGVVLEDMSSGTRWRFGE